MPGYRAFERAETLEASDVNDYLMLQSVMVFETETERNTQLLNVLRPGLTAYVKTTKLLQTYDGSSWRSVALYELLGMASEDDAKKLVYMQSEDPQVIEELNFFLYDFVFGRFPDRYIHLDFW